MQISSNEAKLFFERNHIQGYCSAQYNFALKDNNILIQCVSIGKNRFKKNKNSYELIRMATSLNCQVVGGFSKLIKNSLKTLKLNSIESYIDRRLFSHTRYTSSGRKVIGESGPRYFYSDGQNRFNRQMFMKKSCLKKWPDSDPRKTEHQLCLEHGLFQIYDCGTVKMKLTTN